MPRSMMMNQRSLNKRIARCAIACIATVALPAAVQGAAQAVPDKPATTAFDPATRPADGAEEELITLNLPENVEVDVLLRYVSERLGFNVLYEEQYGKGRVTIETPERIPRSALMDLLQSALKSKDLLLVEGDQPGWKRVVPVANLMAVAPPAMVGEVPAEARATDVLTRIFVLNNVAAADVEPVIKPLLTQPGGNSFTLSEQGLIIVSDFAPIVRRIGELIKVLDQPTREVTAEFVPVRHAAPAQLAGQLQEVLTARLRAQGVARPEQTGVEVVENPRTGELVLLGPRQRVEAARELLMSLDVPVADAQSPIRFYKLANTTAVDVLATIRAIEGAEEPAGGGGIDAGFGPAGYPPEDGMVPLEPQGGMGAGAVPTLLDRQPMPRGGAANQPQRPRGAGPADGGSLAPMSLEFPGEGVAPGYGRPGEPAEASLGFSTARARVAADPNTNTLIVIADPAVQQQYELLIEQLDKRRPQVLIEVTVVTLDTSRGYSFGVDVSYTDTDSDPSIIAFDSFGVSRVNPVTSRLIVTPQLGFNGALLSADTADVVLRALATNRRAKVMSAPRILVNDNAEGRLSSVAESPFTSVNAFDTVATTSFAGYARAGTTISLVPHISDDDYLQLEYEVELSSFTGTGAGADGVPPPRLENSVQSEVTIPDGTTIVVGGLNASNFSETIDSVPILGQIPIIKYLFSNRRRDRSETSLFVFIRPVILRDDRFADLKFLSGDDMREAGLPSDLPHSEPLTIHEAAGNGGM